MAQSLSEKVRIKRFIKDIHKKHFLEIYEFARWRSDLTNEQKNILIEEMISSGNDMLITNYTINIKWLTKENIDTLTKFISKTGDARNIFKFSLVINNFSNKNLDLLTEAIIETKYYKYIFDFAKDIKNLSLDNISLLTNSIVNSKNQAYIYEFARYIKGLSDNDKTNLVDGISKTNNAEAIFDFADNISWLEKEHMDLLIEGLKKAGSGYYINEFVNRFWNDLSKDQLDILVDAIISTGDAASIAWFAQLTELTKENKNKLTIALIDLEDPKYMCDFAIKVKDLPEVNINALANAIVKSNSSGSLYLFLVMVPNLNKEKCKLILDRLFELKDFGVIKLLIDDYLVKTHSERFGSDFEKRIIETKDIFVIAYYLFRKADEILIKQFFDTKEKFLLFIFINKSILGIKDNEIKVVENDANFKYVDENISKYLGNKKVNKKQS